ARSPGRRIVFWDEHADLDGNGVEEVWYPRASDGRVAVRGVGAKKDRILDLEVFNRGATDAEHLFLRYARIPRLVAADLDGDGRRDLVAYRDGTLVAWSLAKAGPGPVAPYLRLALPFARHRPLDPEKVFTPRIHLADVDADGKTDLLVTLVTGDRRKPSSFRTRLLHYPGPFVDPETGKLTAPAARIDTESVALHPRFVDLDGDGRLDYVCDSIVGGRIELLRRVLGQEPTIWHKGFRFDPRIGTYESEPAFSLERPYSREEAVSNHFGPSAFFGGDFDGDGLKDMLDLGNLNGWQILGGSTKHGRGPGSPLTFTKRLLPRRRTDQTLAAAAVLVDLDGDGREDAVTWDAKTLYLSLSGGRP
ncbi:MAG: FG-GAP repeat domain-containing protein, partial [Planctomycetota bacterium]